MASPIARRKQPHEILNHILDQPDLPEIIPRLDSNVLTRLIRHVGLEDCAPVVSLATADQLKGVLDEDLWYSHAPGQQEVFDGERFGLWLEILLENGTAVAVQKVLEMDEELLILGLRSLVRVAGVHDAMMFFTDDPASLRDDVGEKVLDRELHQQFGDYLVMAENPLRWDAVCTFLAHINELDDERLVRLLERCRRVSVKPTEDDGNLSHVLDPGEMLQEDVAADREDRREEKGFVTPTAASVFLHHARTTPLEKILGAKTMDPVTRSYEKAAERQSASAVIFRNPVAFRERQDTTAMDAKVGRFLQILRQSEVLPTPDPKLLGYNGAEKMNHPLPLASAMELLSHSHPDLYARRLLELSYLSNTLISGCACKNTAFQPKEAAEAAFSVCNLGSEAWLGNKAGNPEKPDTEILKTILVKHHLARLFAAGWRILYKDVVMASAKALVDFLHRLEKQIHDPDHAHDLAYLAAMVRSSIRTGKPWTCAAHLDSLLSFLDGPIVAGLEDLLQEYPTLPAIIGQGHPHTPSPWIGSRNQIQIIGRFLKDLG